MRIIGFMCNAVYACTHECERHCTNGTISGTLNVCWRRPELDVVVVRSKGKPPLESLVVVAVGSNRGRCRQQTVAATAVVRSWLRIGVWRSIDHRIRRT